MGDGGKEGEGGREKEVLIGRILELQNTLHDLTQRVNSVKEENSKLKSENEVDLVTGEGQGTLPSIDHVVTMSLLSLQILNQYIENLMSTSGMFKSTDGRK